MNFKFKFNEDAEHVARIKKGLEKKGGKCPCKLGEDEYGSIQCPCNEFTQTGHCHCRLYIKIED